MPSLNMLPIQGTSSPMITTMGLRRIAGETLNTLDVIRGTKGFPSTSRARLHLDNARFHVAAALALLDTHLRMGGSWSDPASSVPQVAQSIDLYQLELKRAKQLLNELAMTEARQRMPIDDEAEIPLPQDLLDNPVPQQRALSAYGTALGADAPLVAPKTIDQIKLYMIAGFVVAGSFWLLKKI